MRKLHHQIKEALELLRSGNVLEAEAVLAAVEADVDRFASKLSDARHDLGNTLSIARASVEGMLDGIVPIDDVRLNRLREILSDTGDAVGSLTADCASVPAMDLPAIQALAQAKDVTLACDPGCDFTGLSTALLKAVREAPPGAVLRAGRTDSGELSLHVSR